MKCCDCKWERVWNGCGCTPPSIKDSKTGGWRRLSKKELKQYEKIRKVGA